MSALIRSSAASSIERLMAHLRVPLYRNGYALVINSMTSSGLGLLYWLLAAHYYSTDAIGLNAAAVAAMMFLANISQFNLTNALTRFIPTAGPATSHLVIYAYLISATVGLLTSLIFIVGVDIWSPELGFLKSTPLFILWFTSATVAWCILVLQDSVLTGLRQASWVPLENLLFALARVALAVSFAAILPRFGVFASWTAPLFFVLILTNLLLFRRLIPRHVRATEGQALPIKPSQIVRFVSADYSASLVWMATINLLPLIVLERAGPSANAYFFLSWTICYALYLISLNMGMSLVAEAATDQTKLAEYSVRVLVQTARLLLPVVAVLVLGAPYLLRLFGNSYADEGTMLLRLLSLSAIPNIVTSLYISYARVQRRMLAVFLVLAALCSLAFSLSYVLMEVYGITGIGIAWLLSQTIIATVLLFTQLRRVWLSRLDMYAMLRFLATPRSLGRYWSRRRRLDRAGSLIPDILPTVLPIADVPPPTTWRPQRPVRNVSEVTVIALGPTGHPPVALLKLPRTDNAAGSLLRQRTVLADLHSDPRLGHWRTLLPTLLAEGKILDQPYFVEKMLPGLDARRVLSDPATCWRFQLAAAGTIRELHQRTGSPLRIDEGLLGRWIDEPLRLVRCLKGKRMQNKGIKEAIERTSEELRSALAGRTLTLSWIHGDFAPGNILVTPDGASLTGIVDWDQSAQKELPQLDLVHLLLSTRVLVHHRELGDIIRELLTGGGWTPQERAILGPELSGDAVEMRTMILLTWLRHVASNLTKSIAFARHWLWVTKNVEGVLRYTSGQRPGREV